MKLRNIDVTEHTEKKGKFSYLSWAWAVDKLIEHYPDATWEVHHFPMMVLETVDAVPEETEEGKKLTFVRNMKAVPEMQVPYMRTDTGYFVQVSVTVNGIARTQIHPVLDHTNRPIAHPDSFQINTAIQRCLAKAIALHGLGLYIYAGEDLPPEPIGKVTGEKLDSAKIQDAIKAIKKEIDDDDPDHAVNNIRAIWSSLTADEMIEVQNGLGDKAKDSNRMYKTLIKDYLNHKEEVA